MRINDFKGKFRYTSFTDSEIEFLKQSNYIEAEYGSSALEQAMQAWDYMRRGCGNFRLATILQVHHTLMVNIDSTIAGKIRECDVYIGGACRPFISTQLIRNDLTHLFIKIRAREISPKEAHITFEHIHPFVDGNGRVGRIIYNAHRRFMGLGIHVIREAEKGDYYDWFSKNKENTR